jgi:hypothetical protein
MRALIHIVALTIVLAARLHSMAAGPDQVAPRKARVAIEQWLSLVDQARAAESWSNGADLFRAAGTREQWAFTVQHLRHTLGLLEQRRYRGARFTDRLPTGQAGVFVIHEFDSEFNSRPGTSFETVAAALELDGEWRVAWYDVK